MGSDGIIQMFSLVLTADKGFIGCQTKGDNGTFDMAGGEAITLEIDLFHM